MKAGAFTKIELLVSVATVGLLSAIGVSVTADTRERSERIVCMNNLRQIGRAFHAWAAEHGGDSAWWTLPANGGYWPQGGSSQPIYYVPGVGAFSGGIVHNPFWHFLWIHEDLPSPSVLVCPSDPDKRRAASFSATAGGLAHLSMQNNAVSYLVGLHATRELPNEWLSGDRNVIASSTTSGCSSGITGLRTIMGMWRGGLPTGWTNGMHVTSGNLLLNDGRVEPMTSRDLNMYVNTFTDDASGLFHLLIP